MSTRRPSLISRIGFPSFVPVVLAMGCANGTNAGLTSTGGAGGGLGSTAVTTTGGVTVAATGGSSVGTSAGGAAGGTAGTSTSAAGGSAVVDCNPPATIYCTPGTVPPDALISGFSIAAGATTPVVFGTWGQSIFGGTYVYPTTVPACGTGTVSAYPLTQTVADGNWNIQGTVDAYSGLGLWWECNTATAAPPTYADACTIDASAYGGISFVISGSIGPVSTGTGSVGLAMAVSTPSTAALKLDSAGNPKNCGTCTATTCGSSVAVPVTATATAVEFTWDQLGVTTPYAIAGISFSFTDPFSLNSGYATTPYTATQYPVDITISTFQFTPSGGRP